MRRVMSAVVTVLVLGLGLTASGGPPTQPTYELTVYRGTTPKETDQGTLVFKKRKDGALAQVFRTTCWWAKDNVIPSGRYGAVKTRMASKPDSEPKDKPKEQRPRRPGLLLKDVPGHEEIFVHEGKDASWSEGCIVIARARLMEIFDDPAVRKDIEGAIDYSLILVVVVDAAPPAE